MDLFDQHLAQVTATEAPLAARMRPLTLDEFVGQDHIIGQGRLLRRAISLDQLSSLIFYGPPGTGKTTLARVIANTTHAHFIAINAVLSGVKEIRAAIETAQQQRKFYNQRTILFVDEVHRFNKSQQDALLWDAEDLQRAFEAAGLAVEVFVEQSSTQIHITPGFINRLFTANANRPSYADRLAQNLTSEEIHSVNELFTRFLLNQTVTWMSSIAFLQAGFDILALDTPD
jgi:SpoVK/Ycf46/Vps4 family AAA+-type ATPase